ncbi:Cytosolic Fe-S cluster assembly factor NARFL, partial [Neolecta irregularis DAH-3]
MSRILRAEDLNDFISPGQACIKPVEIVKTNLSGKTEIRVDGTSYYEVGIDGSEKQLEAASITLNDCLACSGCITSAESVLVSLQSHNEVNKVLKENQMKSQGDRQLVVISISPQSRASIAAAFNLSIPSTHARLVTFLTEILNFDYVFDISIAREICLHESAQEFLQRYGARKMGGEAQALPVLASSCPGWICYAEKTHGEVLPYMSRVRSPQQIMGMLLKSCLFANRGIERKQIYHVSVMPCFDKKLEASRGDFEVDGTRDVDCVITTTELVAMIKEANVDLREVTEAQKSKKWDYLPYTHLGSSSGGYLAHIMTLAAQQLFDINDLEVASQKHITIKTIRNNDMKEYTLLSSTGDVLLRMATCYGFRNIQNLVRKLKKDSPGRHRTRECKEYDYVEVMACPGGCINGGGQVKPVLTMEERIYTPKEWVDYVEGIYQGLPTCTLDLKSVQEVYGWMRGQEKELLYTGYRAVEHNLGNPLGEKWISGCITSAESVLVSLQSHNEVNK